MYACMYRYILMKASLLLALSTALKSQTQISQTPVLGVYADKWEMILGSHMPITVLIARLCVITQH